MIFEGIPWPLVLPIACLALVIGVINSKKEIAVIAKKRSNKKTKK